MYLPHKPVVEYRRGQTIYGPESGSQGIYLVMNGRVKVSTYAEDGTQTVMTIASADEFFGESGLVGLAARDESAAALDRCAIMYWTRNEIEEQIQRQPQLGLALMALVSERCLELEERTQYLAFEKTPRRVGLSLLHFARKMGTPVADGSVRIPPMTHRVIADYVCTSREIVTFQLNHLRREGFIRYSRKGIEIYADALRDNYRTQVSGGQADHAR